MKQILAGAALLLLTTSALAQGAPKAPTVGGKRLVHVKPIAPTAPKNSTALDLMPTIYLLRERSGIIHLGQSLGKRADRRRRCSRQAHRAGWILNN